MRIYVASSWRNPHQPQIVNALEADGHEVYDFRNPAPGNTGFHWSSIDPHWPGWTVEEYLHGLEHRLAVDGYNYDMSAMKWADACVLVMPCGRSAHLEAGWFCGSGKPVAILHDVENPIEPELMTKMCDFQTGDIQVLRDWLRHIRC